MKPLSARTDFQWAHELAIDASPAGVALCDEEGRIRFANPRLGSIFGYDPDELLGAPVELVLPNALTGTHPVDRQRFWNDVSSRPTEARRDSLGRRKDGSEVLVQIGIRLAAQNGQRLVIASVVDLTEVEQLRDRLALENVQLRNEVRTLKVPAAIAAESLAVKRVLAQIEHVASTNATVLLLGETGSGKEVFAQAIHDASDRRGRPMVRLNCAAIPAQLLESELFGRERGAYTGALSRQAGRFEMAEGSTLLLDEIGELPFEAQVKLLRVLQDRVIERLGGGRPVNVDVRIIAATNRDLAGAVANRTFREDLFYRLNVFPITVPPLRERVEDIPVLIWSFVAEFSKAFNKTIDSISREDIAALQRHPWPGNVRELRNVIERAVIVAAGPHLTIPPLQPVHAGARENATLSDVEVQHIRAVLEKTGWRVRGPGGAAEILGIKPTTLDSRMARLGIRRPSHVKL